MREVRLAVGFLFISIGAAVPARAQGSEPLAGLLLRFFSPDQPVVLRANPNPALSHAAHFVSQPGAQATLRSINSGIAAQISTFPLGASSAGFTYTFDESLGTYNRTTQSFGPIFTERPLTAGKGKFTFGVNYQNATWDSLDGRDLEGDDLNLYLEHQDTNNDGGHLALWFEGDVIRADLKVALETKTTVVYATYGLTERFDLSVAMPFLDVSLDARIVTSIERLATQPDLNAGTTIHIFDDGQSTHTYPESGSASGIGDVLVRAKYNFLRKPGGSLAAFLDVRLPTGDENDLLGSGATQAKLALVAGGSPGRFSPRASFGYTFSSGGSDFTGDLPDELYYTAGFDIVPHRRFTITADFIGRTLLDATRLVDQDTTFNFRFRPPATTTMTVTRTQLATSIDNVNLMLGSAGIKINPVGNLLLVGNVLFKIGSNGLQDKVTPVFGLDYTF
jgi:Putative MetA-pathway of phenol degradation